MRLNVVQEFTAPFNKDGLQVSIKDGVTDKPFTKDGGSDLQVKDGFIIKEDDPKIYKEDDPEAPWNKKFDDGWEKPVELEREDDVIPVPGDEDGSGNGGNNGGSGNGSGNGSKNGVKKALPWLLIAGVALWALKRK